MIRIIDNGKPDIKLGVQEMFGRMVEVRELIEPTLSYHPMPYVVQKMYFAVIETYATGLKTVWLWDGYLSN